MTLPGTPTEAAERPSTGTGLLGRWRLPLLAAVLVVGAALRLAAASHHVAVDFDEGRYLDNALNILHGRGLATSYTSHFFREPQPGEDLRHPEDISAPLYPYLLAGTFAVLDAAGSFRPADAHRVAQLWSLLAGCLCIVLTFRLGERLFDQRTALLASMLVALNPDMIILSSWAMTEPIYTALILATLLAADTSAMMAGTLVAMQRPLRLAARWGGLGLLCGLLYLVRPNGLAVTAGLGLAVLLSAGAFADRVRRAALLAAVFLLVVSPWLYRNTVAFGAPTYTAMKNVAWSEDGRDLFAYGSPPPPPPSMSRYLEKHGAAGLARNLAHRAARAAGNLVWGDTGGYNLLCLLFPVAVALTWRVRRLHAGHLVTLASAALLFGVPTWTGALSRYLLPARPWIYLAVVGAAMQVVPGLVWRRRHSARPLGGAGLDLTTEPARRLTAAAAATLVAVVGWASMGPLQQYVARDESQRDLSARQAAEWIRTRTEPDAVLMEGAWVHQYAFLYDRPVVWAPAGGLTSLMQAAGDFGADYLVVSGQLLRFRPELKTHFTAGAQGVRGENLPPGFKEVYSGVAREIVIWKLPDGAGA